MTLVVVAVVLVVIGVALWRMSDSRPERRPGTDPSQAATLAVNSSLDATRIDHEEPDPT